MPEISVQHHSWKQMCMHIDNSCSKHVQSDLLLVENSHDHKGKKMNPLGELHVPYKLQVYNTGDQSSWKFLL